MRSRSDPLSILANPRCLSPQAVDALKKSLAPKANAKRNGKWVVVKGVELVLPTMTIPTMAVLVRSLQGVELALPTMAIGRYSLWLMAVPTMAIPTMAIFAIKVPGDLITTHHTKVPYSQLTVALLFTTYYEGAGRSGRALPRRRRPRRLQAARRQGDRRRPGGALLLLLLLVGHQAMLLLLVLLVGPTTTTTTSWPY